MDPVPKARSNNRGADLVNNKSWKFHGCDGGAVALAWNVDCLPWAAENGMVASPAAGPSAREE
jgi:hypothetical protein